MYMNNVCITVHIMCIYICNHENNVPSGYHHNVFVATHASLMTT